jgi:hypothetical protein
MCDAWQLHGCSRVYTPQLQIAEHSVTLEYPKASLLRTQSSADTIHCSDDLHSASSVGASAVLVLQLLVLVLLLVAHFVC